MHKLYFGIWSLAVNVIFFFFFNLLEQKLMYFISKHENCFPKTDKKHLRMFVNNMYAFVIINITSRTFLQ